VCSVMDSVVRYLDNEYIYATNKLDVVTGALSVLRRLSEYPPVAVAFSNDVYNIVIPHCEQTQPTGTLWTMP